MLLPLNSPAGGGRGKEKLVRVLTLLHQIVYVNNFKNQDLYVSNLHKHSIKYFFNK